MYKVLTYFEDMQDNSYPYDEGDIFPRDGLSVTEERLQELSSIKNKRGIRLIQFVEDKVQEQPRPLSKTEVNRMSTAELKKLASDNGIKHAGEMTGAELKKLLIAHFEL